MQKLRLALKEYTVQTIAFEGGVTCNKYIRARLLNFSDHHKKAFFVPSPTYCTNNGAMIAFVGHYKAQQEKWSDFALDILE